MTESTSFPPTDVMGDAVATWLSHWSHETQSPHDCKDDAMALLRSIGYDRMVVAADRQNQLARLVATARKEGWYEDNTSWYEVDDILDELGIL